MPIFFKRCLASFSLLVLFLFCSTRTIYSSYFEDFTSTLDTSVWSVHENGGTVEVSNGFLHINRPPIPSNKTPYLYSNNTIFPTEGSFSYEIKYRYTEVGNFGVAITTSSDLFPINGTNPDANLPSYMKFMVYQDLPNGLSFGKILCDINNNNCTSRTFLKPFTHIPDTNTHVFRIIYSEAGEYEIYLDYSQTPDFKSGINQPRPKYIWIGNPMTTNSLDLWNSIDIDYIKVERLDESKNPVIILPGFGGSWDLNAILSGNSGNNWQIPEFIKEYDGIINSLKNAGYTENQDLFIFPYDWRKPLDNLADDLNEFIANNSLEDKQINLVGHSMGGLVARSYTQKYNNPNINKVVTAGSPHKGIVDAYGMWEGLTVWDAVWWQKVLVGIASEMDRNQGETRLDAVRRFAPSIKDLLPTDNFLINAGIPVSISNMAWKNDYLLAQNSNLGGFLQKIFAGASADKANTKDKINVTNPSKSDQLRGLWQDGKPNQTDTFLYTIGDGYVNHNSAQSLFTNTLNLEGWHGETISKKENIIKILSELNIATESAVGSVFDNRKNVLIFKLNSPGKIDVCFGAVCNEDLGLIFENEKMILVPGYSEGNYSVKVNANNETGSYQLLVGELKDENTWQTQQGNLLTSNQLDIYQYDTSADQITASPETIARNNNIFWPTGIDQKKINETRQKILLDIDENIRNGHYEMFDTNIAKWKALDTFVVSLSSLKKGFTHAGWDKSSKSAVKSKYLGSSASYFTDRLVELFIATDASYRNTPKNLFTKQDKQIQTIMLKIFIGL